MSDNATFLIALAIMCGTLLLFLAIICVTDGWPIWSDVDEDDDADGEVVA